MLLKDCPVGSVVRCVKWAGDNQIPYYVPTEITVESDGEKYFIDTSGMKWEEYDCQKDDFEIIHPAPIAAPEPRITFTVGGQEFYVGQRVWSNFDYTCAPKGAALEVIGPYDEFVVTRVENTSSVALMDIPSLSTTPPSPHEWKRGDWARHEKRGVGFVLQTRREYVVLSFSDETAGEFLPSELTFISHSEPPK